jgi:putative spermidine/putrescine transport system permease protein
MTMTARPASAGGSGVAREASLESDRRPRAAFDPVPLLVIPSALLVAILFAYAFLHGVVLSFTPAEGDWLASYRTFFDRPAFYQTVATTLWISVPATIINVGLAIPMAYCLRRPSGTQRFVTTLLVIPMTLGTVLVAEGLLTYLGPQGWFVRVFHLFTPVDMPVRLTHNYWGVLLSLIITGFPFAFLLILSYITGIDPTLARAAATLGASPWRQFREIYLPLLVPGLAVTFSLSFVQAFSVFPSAVLLGAPAGPTRVMSIAAYQAAFEEYDYSLASVVAVLMGLVQLAIVLGVLGLRRFFYSGPTGGAKG